MFLPLLMAGPAGEQGATQGNPILSLLPIIVIFVALYLFLILPQQRKQKKHMEQLSAIKKGDKILTTGGIIGQVVGTKDEIIVIKIAEGVKIEVNKSYVASVLDETGKALEA